MAHPTFNCAFLQPFAACRSKPILYFSRQLMKIMQWVRNKKNGRRNLGVILPFSVKKKIPVVFVETKMCHGGENATLINIMPIIITKAHVGRLFHYLSSLLLFLSVVEVERTLSQYRSFKIRRTTFLNYTKFAVHLILRL